MSQPDEKLKPVPYKRVSVDAFLTVPGAEIIIKTPEDKTTRLETLIAILSRVAAQEPNRRVEYWIKFLD